MISELIAGVKRRVNHILNHHDASAQWTRNELMALLRWVQMWEQRNPCPHSAIKVDHARAVHRVDVTVYCSDCRRILAIHEIDL